MITVNAKDGSVYQYQETTGLIIKDGVVQSTTDYEPLYIPGSAEFSGVLDKTNGTVISMTGDIGNYVNYGTIQ